MFKIDNSIVHLIGRLEIGTLISHLNATQDVEIECYKKLEFAVISKIFFINDFDKTIACYE